MGAGGSKEERPELELEEVERNLVARPVTPPLDPDNDDPHPSDYSDIRFGDGRFKMHCIIGRGGFGLVVAAVEIATSNLFVLKIESDSFFTYKNELLVFQCLKGAKSTVAPTLFSHWNELGYSIMQMEVLGMSLLDYVRNKKSLMLSMSSACKLAPQMIDLIHALHDIGVLHCDIKPANFVFGLGSKAARLKLIDFGLAMGWRHPEGAPYDFVYRVPKGTPAYMSVNQHLNYGNVNTRRDDLESMVYTLMDLCRIPMPWKTEYNLVREGDHGTYWMLKGGGTDGGKICKNSRFKRAIRLCRSTKWNEAPDYEAFKEVFKDNSFFVDRKKKVQPKLTDAIMNLQVQEQDENILDLFRNKSPKVVPQFDIVDSATIVEELSDDEDILK